MNINLLPWRDEAKEKRKRDYIGLLAITFLAANILLYAALGWLDYLTHDQKNRNQYLASKIEDLETQIAEISLISKRKKDIEHRRDIILQLQQQRNLPTHVLDELVRIVPPGIYLSSVEKKSNQLWIEGSSESNNNVSNMMRKVTSSHWLHDPVLQSIVSKKQSGQLQQFQLRVAIHNKTNDGLTSNDELK